MLTMFHLLFYTLGLDLNAHSHRFTTVMWSIVLGILISSGGAFGQSCTNNDFGINFDGVNYFTVSAANGTCMCKTAGFAASGPSVFDGNVSLAGSSSLTVGGKISGDGSGLRNLTAQPDIASLINTITALSNQVATLTAQMAGLQLGQFSQDRCFGLIPGTGTIYVVGGAATAPNSGPSVSVIQSFSAGCSSWLQSTFLPVRLHWSMPVIHLGSLYSFGGVTDSTTLSAAYKFDLPSGATTSLANLPAATSSGVAVSYQNFIYIIGGNNGSPTSAVWKYDPTSNVYSAATSLPLGITYAGAVVYGGYVYLVAGASSNALATLYRFNGTTWTQLPSMTVGRNGPGVALLADEIWVIGGRNTAASVVNSVEKYNITAGTWSTMPAIMTARAWCGAGASGGDVYVFGGSSSSTSGPGISSVEKYSASLGRWLSMPMMSVTVSAFGYGVA
eukprot:TRINITY_DN26564_c0_g1_i1.p1 TRINITY_DN26564_c0_g1~~TRINITY_DN26564_c0_g1_i1.p1  ORF type:complete len:446 (-),score=79.69 TRINITY_DN26564_c0_g1_i1:447-1784(-)